MITPIPEATLLDWWQSHRRHYPWREITDPYRLAVTELMLVRTKADQVLRIWHHFFERYPNIPTLVEATEQEVVQALSSLGLVWRARKVAEFARRVLELYHGQVPLDVEGLRRVLPAGEYAAAAIALQMKGKGALPVDTGIARFINRFYGLLAGGELRRNARVLEALSAQGERTRIFFYALLELTWLVCLPRQPHCLECPLRYECVYGQDQAAGFAQWKALRDRAGCKAKRLPRSLLKNRVQLYEEVFLAEHCGIYFLEPLPDMPG